ncbi:hypothetical protein BC831DRAFT_166577 [Entophlyctis helioformis]|nr:hypothetical protein BC831DRAFT_166577 [Entophlyctis helioformis]
METDESKPLNVQRERRWKAAEAAAEAAAAWSSATQEATVSPCTHMHTHTRQWNSIRCISSSVALQFVHCLFGLPYLVKWALLGGVSFETGWEDGCGRGRVTAIMRTMVLPYGSWRAGRQAGRQAAGRIVPTALCLLACSPAHTCCHGDSPTTVLLPRLVWWPSFGVFCGGL